MTKEEYQRLTTGEKQSLHYAYMKSHFERKVLRSSRAAYQIRTIRDALLRTVLYAVFLLIYPLVFLVSVIMDGLPASVSDTIEEWGTMLEEVAVDWGNAFHACRVYDKCLEEVLEKKAGGKE